MTSPLFETAARTLARSDSVGRFSDYATILKALTDRFKTEAELRAHLLVLIRQLPFPWRAGASDEEMLAIFLANGTPAD